MQDGASCNPFVRVLAIWSGAFAGLMMILVGGLLPSALILPGLDFPPKVFSLPRTWQVPSVLLCALVCGPRAAVIASVAYITVGLISLPIFHSGGSLDYLATPGFGYLTGFIPASWVSGHLAQRKNVRDLISLTICALIGLMVLQVWGILYLTIGASIGSWSNPLSELLFNYSFAPLPAQLILCPGVGVISISLRQLLFIE